MYAKKIVFSAATAPALVFLHQLAEYQNRRGEEKRGEADRRQQILKQAPVDITPANKGKHIWSEAANIDKFESEWSMKPVQVKGIFDHSREMKISKERNGEKGVDVVTPFYTHLGADNKEQAILVNRGWLPHDLKDQRLHYQPQTMGAIQGILYRGDCETKYSKKNSPTHGQYSRVVPAEISLIT